MKAMITTFLGGMILLFVAQSAEGQQFAKESKAGPPARESGRNAQSVSVDAQAPATRLKALLNKNASSASVRRAQSAATNSIPARVRVSSPSGVVAAKDAGTEMIVDKESGTPLFLKEATLLRSSTAAISSGGSMTAEAYRFINDKKSLLQIESPNAEFEVSKVMQDELGMTHIKMQQVSNGVEVWGKEMIVHVGKDGFAASLTGRIASTKSIVVPASPNVAKEAAVNAALADIRQSRTMKPIPAFMQSQFGYTGPAAKQVIWFDKNQSAHLAWHVEVRNGVTEDWYYFVDAANGKILDRYNNVCTDGPTTGSGNDLNGVTRSFGTVLVSGVYYMIDASEPMFVSAESRFPDSLTGALECFDLRGHDVGTPYYYVGSTNDTWNDASTVSAHFNGITTYNFYRTTFGRNSIDDAGMSIYSFVHVTEDSLALDNAFWNGMFMCYGDGATFFKPLAGGLDVAAHEMTHGVTQHTANLVYQGQSGALNESISDVFATLVDTLNWTIGEQIIKDMSTFPSGALRDLSNPHNGGSEGSAAWQPATMSEFGNTSDDNGGVHLNSGIPNHAFYLVASSIGRHEAGQIWYRALTVYLTRSAQFLDARIATAQAASDLFGAGSNEVTVVKNSWDAVGVVEGTPPSGPPTTQLVGQDWIIAVNTDPGDPNSIYVAKPLPGASGGLSPLTTTSVLNRPAVTDTSGLIVFVDSDNDLRAISSNPSSPGETVVDTQHVWWSVAIGPGSSSLALTTKFVDTSIYYFDLNDESQNKKFKLTSPSYDGSNTSTSLYADAMSFDPTGRYLLFDVYNQVKNQSGALLGYWTINVLDVTSGQIQSIFPPLPEGVSVGDPSYSKASPTRFLFDYIDSKANRYAVMAADFNTGEIGIVGDSNGTVGYPTYAGDDKTVAYHTLTNFQSALHDAIQLMPMQSDFLSGTHSPESYVVDATFPVWFVVGSRVTAVKESPAIIKAFALENNYPNPFNPSTVISYQLAVNSHVTLRVYDILGRKVATLVDEQKQAGSYQATFNGSKFASGVYFYRMEAGSFVQTKKLVLAK
jgi:bacillolysin